MCHMSGVTCHVYHLSYVTCHVSGIACQNFFFWGGGDTVVGLFGGRSVFNRAYPIKIIVRTPITMGKFRNSISVSDSTFIKIKNQLEGNSQLNNVLYFLTKQSFEITVCQLTQLLQYP